MDRKRETAKRDPRASRRAAGAIISPDTFRGQRIPPGQSRTKKWPVLDAGGSPHIDLDTWKFSVYGMTGHPVAWNWREFNQLPRVRVFADFHCVTRWSRLGNVWEGVSTREIMARAGGPLPEAAFGYWRMASMRDSRPTFRSRIFWLKDALVAAYTRWRAR